MNMVLCSSSKIQTGRNKQKKTQNTKKNKQVSLHRLVVCFENCGNSICGGRCVFLIYVHSFFLGFQLFMFSKLGHLPICVIYVTSLSVSSVSPPVCVICVASLSVSFVLPPYLCHLCCLLMCVIFVCVSFCAIMCVVYLCCVDCVHI